MESRYTSLYFCRTKVQIILHVAKRKETKKMKYDFSEQYELLTPKNQRRLRNQLSEKFNWKSRQSIYNTLRGKSTISEIEKSYIDNLFRELFEKQIQSVQL